MNKGLVIGGTVVLAIVAFIAGAFLGPKVPLVATVTGTSSSQFPDGRAMAGGPMARLTDEERAQLESMTEEERRQFLQDKMGDSAPGGTQGAGGPGGRGGMSIEGEVLAVANGAMTLQTSSGGSQRFYLSDSTVVAYVEDAEQAEIAKGDAVIVTAQPAADNVMTATAVIVK